MKSLIPKEREDKRKFLLVTIPLTLGIVSLLVSLIEWDIPFIQGGHEIARYLGISGTSLSIFFYYFESLSLVRGNTYFYRKLQDWGQSSIINELTGILESAGDDDEILVTASVPISNEEYEKTLINKITTLCKNKSQNGSAVFTRIIMNKNDEDMKEWIEEIKNEEGKYKGWHEHIKKGAIKIYLTDEAFGIDIILIGDRKVILGIKEKNPDFYKQNYGFKIDGGKSFYFENSPMVKSIYSYYAEYILTHLKDKRLSLK